MIIVAVIAITAGYLAGAARPPGPGAAASTRAVNTSSTQPSTIAGVGGPGITVGATADVAGTPDTLRLDLSVVVTGPTVSAALAKANSSADAVQRSLLGSGVARKDLQTSGLSITPTYVYPRGGSARLSGYQVSEGVSARLRDLGRAGDAVGNAVGAGGNAVRVNAISLDLEDTGVLVSRARDRAFADAKAKAEQYARAAGRSLGEVESIAENISQPTPVGISESRAAAKDLSSVPIQPGSQDVSVTVTVVFAMR